MLLGASRLGLQYVPGMLCGKDLADICDRSTQLASPTCMEVEGSMRIAGLLIEKEDEKWQIRAWGPLPKATERPNQRRVHLTLVVLAIAILGLVLVLVSQNAPEWGKLLQKLISSAI
jgi:hypothetical protein